MLRRYLILTGMLLVIPVGMLNAQRWLEMWTNERGQHTFQEIQKEFHKYFETHEMERGTMYKQFMRWEYYMEPRVNTDEGVTDPWARTWNNYREYVTQRSTSGQKTTSTDGSWTFFGSQDHFKGNSGYNGGIGRINVIRFHPTSSSTIFVGAPAGGLWKTTNSGSTWSPLTDGIAFWGVSGIAIHPTSTNTMFILTGDGDGGSSRSSGVWKTTNGGTTWTTTGLSWNYETSNIGGYKLLMDPSNSNVMYVVATNGLHKTTDGGVNWSVVKTGSYRDMEFQPGNSSVLLLSSTNTIYRSTDAGASWSTVHSVSGANRIAIAYAPSNSNYAYAVAGPDVGTGVFKGLFRSTDGGVNWTSRSTTPNILGYSSSGSDDKSQSSYDLGIAVNPTDEDEVHVGGINMWRSNDGGVNWSNKSYWVESTTPNNYTHADIHEVVYNGSTLYVGSDGGIFYSTNDADDWNDMSSGLAITEFYRFGGTPMNSNMFVGGAQDNGSNIVEAPIPDLTMEHIYGADGMEAAIDPTNSSTIYYTSQNGGLRRSTDGGNTGTSIKPTILGSGGWVTPFVLHPTNSNTILAGYTDVGVSTNQGNTWTDISSGNVGTGTCKQVAYAPSNANYIYVVKSSAVYRTTNGGTNWSNITTGLPGSTYTYVAVDPTDPDHAYVTRSGFTANSKVFETTDGGSNWSNISGTNLPNVPANTIAYEPGSDDGVYVGTDAGVYYLDDNLTDWVDFSDGLPFLRVMELEINEPANRIRAATYGRSMWESDLYHATCPDDQNLSGPVSGTDIYAAVYTVTSTHSIQASADITYSAGTSITLNPGFTMAAGSEFHAVMDGCGALPMRNFVPISGNYEDPPNKNLTNTQFNEENPFSLGNYPNPTRSHTWVSFELPEAGPVTLEVYNLEGRKVAGLLEQDERDAGMHMINFNAEGLATGQYILRLKTNSGSQSSYMIVAR